MKGTEIVPKGIVDNYLFITTVVDRELCRNVFSCLFCVEKLLAVL